MSFVGGVEAVRVCKGVATPIASGGRESPCTGPFGGHSDDPVCAGWTSATSGRPKGAGSAEGKPDERGHDLTHDRADIAVAASPLAPSMVRPGSGDEVRLKRVLRYHRSHPGCTTHFPPQALRTQATVLTDSAWAGDVGTRSSAPGYMACFGTHLVTFGSRLHNIIALGSGEAKLNAQVPGVCEGLGVASLREFWRLPCVVQGLCDGARGLLGG